jgi:hypothetical protein
MTMLLLCIYYYYYYVNDDEIDIKIYQTSMHTGDRLARITPKVLIDRGYNMRLNNNKFKFNSKVINNKFNSDNKFTIFNSNLKRDKNSKDRDVSIRPSKITVNSDTYYQVSIYLCIYPCVYLCIYLCVYLCIYLSIYLCVYLCVYLSIYLSIYVSLSLSI